MNRDYELGICAGALDVMNQVAVAYVDSGEDMPAALVTVLAEASGFVAGALREIQERDNGHE